ncbi:MAG: prepilin-type N-terminal cleavage/methylation domain-containing protein [Candidatus Nealsonbacteria bacterium]|nr:prepilin-type N-terminal cleavage/methylation domain-containing protein [Candidatus Nealsonbacteria bacterium]
MKNKGLTLIEVIISLFLLTMGVMGTFVILQKIIGYGSLISSRLTAAYLAQEGIELVRNARDTYWLDESIDWSPDFLEDINFCSSAGNGCKIDYNDSDFSNYNDWDYLKIDSGFYNYDSGVNTKFKRKITIDVGASSQDTLKVIVEVSWQDKGQSNKILVQENLYNWWGD